MLTQVAKFRRERHCAARFKLSQREKCQLKSATWSLRRFAGILNADSRIIQRIKFSSGKWDDSNPHTLHTSHTHTHTKKLHRPNSKHTLLSTYFSKLSPLWRWVKDGKSNAAYPQLELLLPKSKITFLSFNFWRWQLQSLIEISGDGQQILNVLFMC